MKVKNRKRKRKGIAAVEAAVCLPVLVIFWFASMEANRLISLKQQGQFLASSAAHRVVESTESFESIQTDMEALAVDLRIQGCVVNLQQFDPEIVESTVTIELQRNLAFSAFLGDRQVTSTYYSLREE